MPIERIPGYRTIRVFQVTEQELDFLATPFLLPFIKGAMVKRIKRESVFVNAALNDEGDGGDDAE